MAAHTYEFVWEWTAGLFFFLCVKSFDVCVCRASRVLRRVFECVTSSGAWVKRMRREREDMGERRENKRYLHAERERERVESRERFV